jgi:hypothetical protein
MPTTRAAHPSGLLRSRMRRGWGDTPHAPRQRGFALCTTFFRSLPDCPIARLPGGGGVPGRGLSVD